MKKTILSLAMAAAAFTGAEAKIWRINNTAGVLADFNNVQTAINNASVQNGDTLHIEPSATNHANFVLSKSLTLIGVGYFLDPASATEPNNAGLQAGSFNSKIGSMNIVASNCKMIGLELSSVNVSANSNGVTFEKCYFQSSALLGIAAGISNLSVRKCFFNSFTVITYGAVTNTFFENNIFTGSFNFTLTGNVGSGNVFRNNSFINASIFSTFNLPECYVANNIFGLGTSAPSMVNATIKNNLFSANLTLPVTATNNLTNVDMTDVYVGGTTNSLDSRAQLKAGSPAIAAGVSGVTVSGATVTSPNCGAFGGTDPYKLSGIPGIPTIYSLAAPNVIPVGTNTLNVTLGTRNNN